MHLVGVPSPVWSCVYDQRASGDGGRVADGLALRRLWRREKWKELEGKDAESAARWARPGDRVHRERGKGKQRREEQRKRREQIERGDEKRRYGEVRMLHRVAALSLHCVPLRHSLVQRFIQLGVPRTKVKRS